MRGVLSRCTKAALEGCGEADKTAPDLFQWLAAADVRHYTPLITACLERLGAQQSAAGVNGIDECSGGGGSKATPAALDQAYASRFAICSTLCDREHRLLLEGLKPETTLDLMGVMAGLPLGYKVQVIFVGRPSNLVIIALTCTQGFFAPDVEQKPAWTQMVSESRDYASVNSVTEPSPSHRMERGER